MLFDSIATMSFWRYRGVSAAGVAVVAVLALASCADPHATSTAGSPGSARPTGHSTQLTPPRAEMHPLKGTPAPAPKPDRAVEAAAQNAAELAADALDTCGTGRSPDTYGGVVITHRSTQVQAYLTHRDSVLEAELRVVAAQADLRGNVPPAPLSFALTPTSNLERRQLAGAVGAAWGQLRGQGYQLVKAVEDIPAGTETLQLLHPTQTQIDSLSQRFGPHLKVEAVTPDQQVFAG